MRPFFFLRQAIDDLRANKMLHALAVSTIALIFLLAGAFALVFVNITQLMASCQDRVPMMIYLDGGQSRADAARIQHKLENTDRITQVRFISKAQAMADLKASMQHQAGLLEGLAENPLPDAFEAIVSPGPAGWSGVEMAARQVERIPGVDEANYGQEWLERFSVVAGMMRVIALALGALLLVAAVSITANTIRLVIYNRREEIRVMELVGATRGFIRASFYIQGMLQGLLGGGAALIMLAVIFFVVSAGLPTQMLLGRFTFHFLPGSYCIIGLTLSVLVGALGCHLSFVNFQKD